MAMVEAMACGVPVGSDRDRRRARDRRRRRDGLLVPIGDVSAMAYAVASLLKDEGLRRAFGVRASEAARARFDIERTVEATERVYEEAVAGGSSV